MSKKSKIFFLTLVIISAIVLLIVGLYKENEKLKSIDDMVQNILASEEPVVLYLSSSQCENCKITTNQIGMMLNYYDFDFYYLDIVEISAKSDKNRILTDLGLDIYGGVTTPSLLIYKDGKLVDNIVDLSGVNKIYDFLIKNNILDSSTKEFIEYLDSETIKTLEDDYVVALTSYTYGECYEFDKLIWNLEDRYDLNIKMLYAEDLDREEGDAYLEEIEYPNIENMGFPTLYVVKDKKVVDVLEGINTLDDYIEFLEKNDIIY